MSNLRKHADLLILAGAVLAILGAVVCFDPSGLVARDEHPETASLYTRREADPPVPTAEGPDSRVDTTPTEPIVLLEEVEREPKAPAREPFQLGVVQLGQGASLGGRLPFPPDNAWNQRIDQAQVDPLSDVLIARIGSEKPVHPDFGSGSWNGADIGIPYVVVSGTQPRLPVKFTAYGNESDPGPYPIPPNAPIEGDPNTDGDRHVIVIDRDNWKLYELFRAFPIAGGQLWRADSGAVFDLATNTHRPIGWTSADAAGLPIFPGLVRYDEAAELKEIRHALRFTVSRTRRAYVPPASHWASRSNDLTLPPMGMRVRLKQAFDISDYPEEVRVILTALKQYGMILADNGSDWYISGAPDPRWNDDNLRKLKQLRGSDFEVVLMTGLVEE